MIYLYSGTPGSGKSLHSARDILFRLRMKKNVIGNIPINTKIIEETLLYKILKNEKYKRKIGKYIYKDDSELNVDFLIKYAEKYHKKGIEGQTLIVIDEAAVKFNNREWDRPDRKQWIKFLQTHRHYGYNIILVSQSDRFMDKQVRYFIEYDVKHRVANNLGYIGMLISIFGIKLFAQVTYWYGVKEKCYTDFFTYKKIYSKLYDSYEYFNNS